MFLVPTSNPTFCPPDSRGFQSFVVPANRKILGIQLKYLSGYRYINNILNYWGWTQKQWFSIVIYYAASFPLSVYPSSNTIGYTINSTTCTVLSDGYSDIYYCMEGQSVLDEIIEFRNPSYTFTANTTLLVMYQDINQQLENNTLEQCIKFEVILIYETDPPTVEPTLVPNTTDVYSCLESNLGISAAQGYLDITASMYHGYLSQIILTYVDGLFTQNSNLNINGNFWGGGQNGQWLSIFIVDMVTGDVIFPNNYTENYDADNVCGADQPVFYCFTDGTNSSSNVLVFAVKDNGKNNPIFLNNEHPLRVYFGEYFFANGSNLSVDDNSGEVCFTYELVYAPIIIRTGDPSLSPSSYVFIFICNVWVRFTSAQTLIFLESHDKKY